MGRRSRQRQRQATAARTASPAVSTVVPSVATAVATLDARDYTYDVIAQLARSSFSAISNPRRRRLRKGDGGYHCDYRTVEELRNISRWLEYHSGSYAGALHNWSQYLVGTGPTYTPTTADVDWNRQAAALLADDWKNKEHDVRKRFTWGRWLKLLATAIVRDGSMGVVHSVTGAAQLIEAERVVGVDTNRQGQVVNYQVVDLRNGFIDYSTKAPVSPAMMDFPAVVTRVSQDLGIPLLFSALDDHDGISDLWQAEIDSATESARPWLTIEHKDGALPGGTTIPQAIGQANAAAPAKAPSARGDAPAGWVKTPNGTIMGLPAGLTGKVHSPERPNLDVPEFTKAVMRMACMMLLPYELLFGDQADISYSNGRSIRKLGNGLLTCFRTDYLEPSCTRIAHARLRQHIAAGRLPLPKDDRAGKDAWKKGKWEWDEIPEHDRIKERQADTIDLNNGTATLKDLVGEDWQEKMEQTAAETLKRSQLSAQGLQKIQELCNKLNTETPGLDIKWSHLVTIGGAASAPGAYLQAATGAVAVEKQEEAPKSDAKPEPKAEPALSPS